ncbi:MAG: hypothetical protein ACOYOL_09590 [Chthoniobacterales bacterium]
MKSKHKFDRPWEIWLVHHTHVDIGYTEPQDVVIRKHAEFVAQALDYCTATDALPPGERFCWTCEVSWTIKAFLARYPERATEFFRRVREGRIEVTALYLQLTDLYTQELLEQTTDYAFELARKHDFEIVTAMNDDVNGWSWGLPDLLARRGVRYFDTAINQCRSLLVGPRQKVLNWTGPEGGRVLLSLGNLYVTGNMLDFSHPESPERVANYLREVGESGCPHHVIEMRIQGDNHDNAPPGLWLCDAVRRWNAEPERPRLRLITAREWFQEVVAHWPEPIMEHQAGWPDWWADGNGSAACESALVRTAQADLKRLAALEVATGRAASVERMDRAREAAAFFAEHTWGAWCSADAPESLTSKAQWNTKAGYAYTAAVEAGSLVQDHLLAEADKYSNEGQGILVFNPSDHPRTDAVEVIVPDQDIGFGEFYQVMEPVRSDEGPAFHLVDEVTGKVVSVQRSPAISDSARRPGQLVKFLAAELPAHSFRRFRVAAGEIPGTAGSGFSDGVLKGVQVEVVPATDGSGIAAIRDVKTGADWGLSHADFTLGEVVYETIPGPFGREKLCGWPGILRDCPFERTRVRFRQPESLSLPYGAGLRFEAENLPGSLRALTLDVHVFDDLPRVDLVYRLEKYPNPEAEALYVAFPLAPGSGEQPTTRIDLPGAVMKPGLEQAPDTATDWHSIQHYFAVSDAGGTTVVASPDIPLVQVNGINTGKWQETLAPHNGLVMSWVMNNYWFTNFPAAQGGTFEWRYSLQRQSGDFDRALADQFAQEIRLPFVAGLRRPPK